MPTEKSACLVIVYFIWFVAQREACCPVPVPVDLRGCVGNSLLSLSLSLSLCVCVCVCAYVCACMCLLCCLTSTLRVIVLVSFTKCVTASTPVRGYHITIWSGCCGVRHCIRPGMTSASAGGNGDVCFSGVPQGLLAGAGMDTG